MTAFVLPAHMTRKRAPSTKPRQHPEQDLQIAVADALSWMLREEYGVFWSAADHSYQGERKGHQLKRMGVKTGLPDLPVIIFQGRHHAIELKSATGTLTEIQKHVHAAIRRAGGKVEICRTVEEVFEQIDRWGIPRLTVKPSAKAFTQATTESLVRNTYDVDAAIAKALVR